MLFSIIARYAGFIYTSYRHALTNSRSNDQRKPRKEPSTKYAASTKTGALAETQAAAGWIQAWGVQRLFVSQVWAASDRWRALEPELKARGILCVWLPATPGISTSDIRDRMGLQGEFTGDIRVGQHHRL